MNNENHKDVYARVFLELGNNDFYNTSFQTLAKKYGDQYFPRVFAALAESHKDSEFNIVFEEENERQSELDDYFVNPETLKNAALWMITENWVGFYKLEDIDSVEKLRDNLRLIRLRHHFLNDEQAQMLIDLLKADPNPYWCKGYRSMNSTNSSYNPNLTGNGDTREKEVEDRDREYHENFPIRVNTHVKIVCESSKSFGKILKVTEIIVDRNKKTFVRAGHDWQNDYDCSLFSLEDVVSWSTQ
jgi:hypothetical protein